MHVGYIKGGYLFFHAYMSKCRQFQGLSTGMSVLTIPNHTIKLQLTSFFFLIFLVCFFFVFSTKKKKTRQYNGKKKNPSMYSRD